MDGRGGTPLMNMRTINSRGGSSPLQSSQHLPPARPPLSYLLTPTSRQVLAAAAAAAADDDDDDATDMGWGLPARLCPFPPHSVNREHY